MNYAVDIVTRAGRPSLQGGSEGFSKMIYPQDVAEAAMMVVKTSFNCCPTQIWLQVRSPAVEQPP